jgi:hypothetical protein
MPTSENRMQYEGYIMADVKKATVFQYRAVILFGSPHRPHGAAMPGFLVFDVLFRACFR